MALCLLVGCSAGVDELQTFVIDDQAFTLGNAITIAPGSAAMLNVVDDACGAFFGEVSPQHVDGEEPLLIAAFADGPFGVASVDGDDPRTYVTSHAIDDYVEIYEATELGRLELHLTFDRVLRRVQKGEDVYVNVDQLDPPVVIEGAVAVRPCGVRP